MNQKKRSFENQLINIFWGLTHGKSKIFKPYSAQFKEWGFKIVGFELVFHTKDNKKFTPDMIMQSKKLEESMIVEWTQSLIPENKKEQIQKYLTYSPRLKAGDSGFKTMVTGL